MQLLFQLFGLVLATAGISTAYQCSASTTGYRQLGCGELSDGDFPLDFTNTNFEGHYESLQLSAMRNENLTQIPAGAINGVTFDMITMRMQNVESIDENFLTESQRSYVVRMEILNCYKLRTFPWQSISLMSKLEVFSLTLSGLTTVEGDIPWPISIKSIDLGYNSALTLVKKNAFKSASGLTRLSMWASSSQIVFEEQSLYTTATSPSFELYFSYGSSVSDPMFADDAFGNVGGGQLWDTLVMGGGEFREETFRLMLKAKFDKNSDHLIMGNFGSIHLPGCMDDCTHAWVYQDAKNYGMDEYEKLLGSNIYCHTGGPILSGGDPNLYKHFDSCPKTPMPWPNNYCKAVKTTTDVITDPEDCHCFFHCNNHEMAGHECCKPGLAFNPILKACDWAYNVPNCD